MRRRQITIAQMLRRFALTVVLPGIILLGFGLRALEQDRRSTEQQVRDRLDHFAEFTARAIDQQLANWQQLQSSGISLETDPVLTITPSQSVAYEPGTATIFEEHLDSNLTSRVGMLDTWSLTIKAACE